MAITLIDTRVDEIAQEDIPVAGDDNYPEKLDLFDQTQPDRFIQLNEMADQQNTMANQMDIVAVEVSDNADISTTKAQEASDNADISTTKAQEASQSVLDAEAQADIALGASTSTLAVAGIDFGSFSVADGNLIVGYYDSEASTPSIVNGKFIITY